MAQEKVKKPPQQVFVMKMTPELAARARDKGTVNARLSRPFAPYDKILLREYNGAPTGRADLTTVIMTVDGVTTLRRGWCWAREAPEDLAILSYAISDEAFPVRLEAEVT